MGVGKWLMVSFGALTIAGLGYAGGARHSWRSSRSTAVRVTVNGERIYNDEVDVALRMMGSPVLQKLIEQHIVLQEAARLGITVSDAELPPIDKAVDVSSRRALTQDLRAQVLLRKILLRGVSEERKREVYSLFKPELSLYEISCIAVADQEEAKLVQQVLEGGESFDKAAARYTKDSAAKGRAGRLGYLTLSAIESKFGPLVSEAASTLSPGGVSSAIDSKVGQVFIKVHSIQSSYTELQGSVETLICQSKQLEETYALSRRAKVVYPGQSKTPAAQTR